MFEFSYNLMEQFQPAGIEEMVNMKPFDEYWRSNENLKIYQQLYGLMKRLFRLSQTFYDISNQNIYRLGKCLCWLFYLLPEETYSFIMDLNTDKCI